MATRKELFSHREQLWILCVGKDSKKNETSPLISLIDWYNNQLLTKSLVAGRINTDFGSLTLMGTSGLLPVDRLLIFGLGDTEALGTAHAKKLAQDLGQALSDLNESSTWVVLPASLPPKFISEFENSRTSIESLSQAKISN